MTVQTRYMTDSSSNSPSEPIHLLLATLVFPHGATDIAVSYVTYTPGLLLRTYCFAVVLCVMLWALHAQLHYVPFFIASWVHFASDVRARGQRRRLLLAAAVLVFLIFYAYIDYYSARLTMLTFLLVLHVPVHYWRVWLLLRRSWSGVATAAVSVLCCTLLGYIQGAEWFMYAEETAATELDAVIVTGIIVGHVLFNDSLQKHRRALYQIKYASK